MSELRESQWQYLLGEARAASTRSYAPYSQLRVGAAALTTTDVLVVGSNVENASYGLTLCAECAVVSDLARLGGGRLKAIMVVAGDGCVLTPCGRCRQLLFEHGGAQLEVCGETYGASTTMGELLPGAFGPVDLNERSER
jgi:cytidine deaminase